MQWSYWDTVSSQVQVEGFSFTLANRTVPSGKSRGGSICIFVNVKWCWQLRVRATECHPDTELLLISSRPFYLPRELRECSSVWQHSRLAAMHTGSPGFHTWRTTACWNGKSFTTLSDTPPGKCVSLYREKSRDAGMLIASTVYLGWF